MKPLLILLLLSYYAFGDLPEPASAANATMRRIKVESVKSTSGRATAIRVEIDVPKQRARFIGTLELKANATINGKPVILTTSFRQPRIYHNFRHEVVYCLVYPKCKVKTVQAIWRDSEDQVIAVKSRGGKFKANKKTRKIAAGAASFHSLQG